MAVSKNSNRVIIAVVMLIATFIIDFTLLRTYDLIPKRLLHEHGILTFFIIVISYSIGQYLLLRIVRQRTNDIRAKNRSLFIIDKFMIIVQCVLLTLLMIILFQLFFNKEYSTHILSLSIAISFGTGGLNLAILAKLFFSWFRHNRHSILAIYGLASLSLSIFSLVILVFVYLTLSLKPQAMTPFLGGSTLFIPQYTMAHTLDGVTFGLSIVSFVLTWVATFFLLKSYSKKLGALKFLLVMSLPLVFYLVQFPIQLGDFFIIFFTAVTVQYAIIFTLVFTFIKLLGAIMFGIAFWIIVRNLDSNLAVRGFMVLAGIGIVFLFISNQASAIVVAPYPPYGLATFLFFALASYLVLAGIYGSAISLVEDSKLRKTVRDYVQSRLLDDIGLASTRRELYDRCNKIFDIYKDELYQNRGLSTSLTEDEVRAYVNEVVSIKESESLKKDGKQP